MERRKYSSAELVFRQQLSCAICSGASSSAQRPENSPRSRLRSWSFWRTSFVRSTSFSPPSNSLCKATGGPVWPRRPRGGIGRNWALSAESSGASLLCHRSRKLPLTIVSKAIRGRSGIYHRAGRPLLMKSPKALPSKVWQSCRTFPTRDGGNENVRRSER